MAESPDVFSNRYFCSTENISVSDKLIVSLHVCCGMPDVLMLRMPGDLCTILAGGVSLFLLYQFLMYYWFTGTSGVCLGCLYAMQNHLLAGIHIGLLYQITCVMTCRQCPKCMASIIWDLFAVPFIYFVDLHMKDVILVQCTRMLDILHAWKCNANHALLARNSKDHLNIEDKFQCGIVNVAHILLATWHCCGVSCSTEGSNTFNYFVP